MFTKMRRPWVLYTLLLALIIPPYLVLFKLDAAFTPLAAITQPDAFNAHRNPRTPIVLISYADGDPVFYKNQNSLSMSAADKGFNRIYKYTRRDIDDSFYPKNKAILDQKRGAGYWLWKPYFILKTMKELPDDAVIIYADSGLIFRKPIDIILKRMENHDILVLSHGRSTPLRKHLKKEAYQAFGFPLTESILNAENVWGFFIVVKNTPKTRAFIQRWLDVCEKAEAITDEPLDRALQDPLFEYHQHDQALLSPLIAQSPDGILIIRRDELRKQFGVYNFHRHAEEELTSPLWIQAGSPNFISKIWWNNYLFQAIRKVFCKQ